MNIALKTQPNASCLDIMPRPVNFALLVGREQWARITPAIRARFDCRAHTKPVTYTGVMERLDYSCAGLLLAKACTVLGTPLPPFCGQDIKANVLVFQNTKGTVWERTYERAGHKPVVVQSTKVAGPDTNLLECIGRGFGMTLKVYEQGRDLHFRSTDYFWQIGGFKLRIPPLLTPGTAHVVHHDEGSGFFRFTLTMTHSLLGQTCFQTGTFKQKGETP